MRTLVLLMKIYLEMQVRGDRKRERERLTRRYNDIGNDVIFAKWWWCPRDDGDGRGGRGNRGKARLSSKRGISRRYRAKPYAPQSRRPLNNSRLLRSLVQ